MGEVVDHGLCPKELPSFPTETVFEPMLFTSLPVASHCFVSLVYVPFLFICLETESCCVA